MHHMSYARGVDDHPTIHRTIPSLLQQRAIETPNKAAHVFRYSRPEEPGTLSGRTVLTFKEMADKSQNIAASLLWLGLKHGDRVALMAANCPEWLLLEYACLRIGVLLIKVPSHFFSAEHFCQMIQETKSKILILDTGSSLKLFEDRFSNFLDKRQNLEEFGLGMIQDVLLMKNVGSINCESISNLSAQVPNVDLIDRMRDIENALTPDDHAVIFQSSGSTGYPKSIVQSHLAYINSINSAYTNIAPGHPLHEIIIFNDRPFSWIGSACLASSVLGCTLVHTDPAEGIPGDAVDKLFTVLDVEKVHMAGFLQFMLFDVMKALENDALTIPSTLKYVGTGGERISQDILHFGLSTFKAFNIIYGATECMAVALAQIEKGDDSLLSLKWYKAVSKSELKLVNDNGDLVPHGEVGVVNIRNPYAMSGYLIDGEIKKSDTDWIDLGDLAIMREDGYFEIVGRKSDVISRGGVKVYPKILEDILFMNDKVEKAVVVGVPDPRMFQEVCAGIVAKPGVTLTEAELRHFFSEKVQANALSCAPKYYLMVEQLPTGTTGKIDRKKLAELATTHFKL